MCHRTSDDGTCCIWNATNSSLNWHVYMPNPKDALTSMWTWTPWWCFVHISLTWWSMHSLHGWSMPSFPLDVAAAELMRLWILCVLCFPSIKSSGCPGNAWRASQQSSSLWHFQCRRHSICNWEFRQDGQSMSPTAALEVSHCSLSSFLVPLFLSELDLLCSLLICNQTSWCFCSGLNIALYCWTGVGCTEMEWWCNGEAQLWARHPEGSWKWCKLCSIQVSGGTL
jgi:hypothetical protein